MENEVRIFLTDNNITVYDIRVYRKINIISGYSSSGKTYLCDVIDGIEDKYSTRLKGCTNREIKHIAYSSVVDYYQLFTTMDNCVIVLDEDFSEKLTNRIISGIQESNNIFIIVTRFIPRALTVSVFAIFELSDIFISDKYYYVSNNNSKIVNDISLMDKLDIDTVYTEDSKLGNAVIKRAINKVAYSLNRKSNISKIEFDCNTKRNILLVVDLEAFGSYINIVKNINNRYGNIRVSNCPSFEYILIRADYNSQLGEELDEPLRYCDIKIYFSMERFFTSLIKRVLKSYSKSSHTLETKFTNYPVYLEYIYGSVLDSEYCVKSVSVVDENIQAITESHFMKINNSDDVYKSKGYEDFLDLMTMYKS